MLHHWNKKKSSQIFILFYIYINIHKTFLSYSQHTKLSLLMPCTVYFTVESIYVKDTSLYMFAQCTQIVEYNVLQKTQGHTTWYTKIHSVLHFTEQYCTTLHYTADHMGTWYIADYTTY